jgi:hypothetical protein
MFNPIDFELHKQRQRDLFKQAQRQRFAFRFLKSQRKSGSTRRALSRIAALFF